MSQCTILFLTLGWDIDVGPMSKMMLGERCIATLGQQIDDVIPTLGQPMIAIWEFKYRLSITYSLIFTFSKCHRNRLFLYFLRTYRISIYSLLF